MDRKNPWIVFLLPFVVFMVVGTLEPTADKPGGTAIWLAIPYSQYPLVYTLKIFLTLAAVIFVLPGYREFSFRISPLAVGVGVVGIILWIGICRLNIELALFEKLGLEGYIKRSSFNPFTRTKCLVLPETRVMPWARAVAAMMASSVSMRLPCFRSAPSSFAH